MKLTVKVTEITVKLIEVDADNKIQAQLKALSIWESGILKINKDDKHVRAEVL